MLLRQCLSRSQSLRCPVCRRMVSTSHGSPHVAIVGSGPAGFYTAQYILKNSPAASVDIYEKLPVPFGLVRFGVAPDHPEVKNVINTFTQTASKGKCYYIGNVQVGRDVSIPQLRKAYSAVVLAYGSDDDRKLNIPGEDTPGFHSAREFVGWYNGLPGKQELSYNFDTDTAVVLGVGNVAMDVARVLLSPIDVLKTTDITDYALEHLSRSRIKRVVLVARRGPLQSAFSTAVLREMIQLEHCKPGLDCADFQPFTEDVIKALPRAKRRFIELLKKTACEEPDPARAMINNQWLIKFLRSPLEVLSEPGLGRVSGLRLGVNSLKGNVGGEQTAVVTEETEDLPCGLAFRSIGYKSVSLDPEVPFDQQKAIVPNTKGRVEGETDLYCSGWLKRGPVGTIATTMTDAFETGKSVVADIAKVETHDKSGKISILHHLKSKGVRTINFDDWRKIDEEEEKRGQELGKPREKLVVVEEMISVVSQSMPH